MDDITPDTPPTSPQPTPHPRHRRPRRSPPEPPAEARRRLPTAPAGPPGPPPGGWQWPPPPEPAAEHRRSLRRSVHNRILGGVAAGLADYLDIDAVIVRIAFVALTVLGGSGVLLYVAGWLLIPAEDSGRAVVQDFMERRPRRRSLIAIVLGTVIGIVGAVEPLLERPVVAALGRRARGVRVLLRAVRAGAGRRARWCRAVAGPGHRCGGWLLTTFIAVVAVVVVAVATVFSVEALSGVPLRGGVGDTQWRPTAASQVAPRYRLAIGNMQVDLSNVAFRPGTTHVTASVGIGNLVVDLPTGTAVSVSAHSGLGDVQVFGQNDGGFSTRRVMQQPRGRLRRAPPSRTARAPGPAVVLDAQTGVGATWRSSGAGRDRAALQHDLTHVPPDHPGGGVGAAVSEPVQQRGRPPPAWPHRPGRGRLPRSRD